MEYWNDVVVQNNPENHHMKIVEQTTEAVDNTFTTMVPQDPIRRQ